MINKGQARYSYQKNTLLSDNLGTKSISEYVNTFFDIGIDFRSYSLDDDSVLIMIGEHDNKQDACELLHNMMDESGMEPDFELISTLIGFDYSGKDEKQDESIVTQFEYLKNGLLDIKYYISNQAEAKVLRILENTFSNILDKHESVFGEITQKPRIVIKGLFDDNQNNSEMKKTNMINKINVIIDMINSCKDMLNREDEYIEKNTELLEKLQAIRDLTNDLKEQLKIIEDEDIKET